MFSNSKARSCKKKKELPLFVHSKLAIIHHWCLESADPLSVSPCIKIKVIRSSTLLLMTLQTISQILLSLVIRCSDLAVVQEIYTHKRLKTMQINGLGWNWTSLPYVTCWQRYLWNGNIVWFDIMSKWWARAIIKWCLSCRLQKHVLGSDRRHRLIRLHTYSYMRWSCDHTPRWRVPLPVDDFKLK